MPNHVTNIIEIKELGGTELSGVRAAFIDKEGFIDFNLIATAPKCLKGFEPHMGIIGAAKAVLQTPVSGNQLLASLQFDNRKTDLEKYEKSETEGGFTDDEKKQVDRAISNIKECGYAYWYDWNSENWETKWNAYSQPEKGYQKNSTIFKFETAWSHPHKLIETLSKKLPLVLFSIKYADEDTGSNCGTYEIKNGKCSNEIVAPSWNKMSKADKQKYTKLAFEISNPGEDPRSRGYDENWEYSDETYEAFESIATDEG